MASGVVGVAGGGLLSTLTWMLPMQMKSTRYYRNQCTTNHYVAAIHTPKNTVFCAMKVYRWQGSAVFAVEIKFVDVDIKIDSSVLLEYMI